MGSNGLDLRLACIDFIAISACRPAHEWSSKRGRCHEQGQKCDSLCQHPGCKKSVHRVNGSFKEDGSRNCGAMVRLIYGRQTFFASTTIVDKDPNCFSSRPTQIK